MSPENEDKTMHARGAGGGLGNGSGVPTGVTGEKTDTFEDPASAAKAVAAAPGPNYFFTLRSNLEPVSNKDTIGFEVPEGIRLHVNYVSENNQVFSEPEAYERSWGAGDGPEDFRPIRGRILSGGDWVLVQKNGVARFDARVTIETVDNVLIDAIFTGVVDLRDAVPSVRIAASNTLEGARKAATQMADDVYQKYLRAGPERRQLPVTLSARFEAAEQPYLRPGEDTAWIEKSRYARQRQNFWKYQRLVRGLFVAVGEVTLDDGPRWPPSSITLAIYELR